MNSFDLTDRFRRIVEQGIGAGDESVLDAFVAEDAVEHQRGNAPGREGAKGVSRVLHRWMSDFSLTVEDVVVSGDLVWTRNRARGTNTGSVMGMAPTNQRVEVDVFDVGRFENGTMVEHWGVADQLGLLLQVGFDPRSTGAPTH
jgi:predicted ester cyclase